MARKLKSAPEKATAPRRYLASRNCEYSLVIESAVDEEDAMRQAGETPLDGWDTAWAPDSVEPMED